MKRSFIDSGVLIMAARGANLASLDALHIAAAISFNADEFITTEKPTKPMYRVPNLCFISI